jgi:hypothetical protein
MKQKMLFRNERVFYKRLCDNCKKTILASHHPDAPYKIFCHDCYYSDKWDPYSFGIEYDRNRPFFEQFGELLKSVPKPALSIQGNINLNSDYVIYATGNTDCYLISNAWTSERCAFSRGLRSCTDTLDSYYVSGVQNGWECINAQRSSNVFYCQNVSDSFNMYYSLNCANCNDCFGSVNLRHKKYCFFNEQLSKEEYEKRFKAVFGSYTRMEAARDRFEQFASKFPRKENNNLKAFGCTGDYIFESNNVKSGFEVTGSENSKFNFSNSRMKDSYDTVGFGSDSELLLEVVAVGSSSRIIGCFSVTSSQDISYSLEIRTSRDCFGCDGLKNADHCILNRRYTEEEYRKIRSEIIERLKKDDAYGQFFPPVLAPFAYNETIAQDYFPLSEQDAQNAGFGWRKREKKDYVITKKVADLPDTIADADDSITNEIIECSHRGTCPHECVGVFRVIGLELEFYRKHNIPLPRLCPNCRFGVRLSRKNPLRLWHRACMCDGSTSSPHANSHWHTGKCPNEFETSYAPDRPEIVYCEKCYQQEVA